MKRLAGYGESLTNEGLGTQCRNQFELVGRAVKIAEYLVKSGKAGREWPDNIAFEVLKRMADEGVDTLEKEVYSDPESQGRTECRC